MRRRSVRSRDRPASGWSTIRTTAASTWNPTMPTRTARTARTWPIATVTRLGLNARNGGGSGTSRATTTPLLRRFQIIDFSIPEPVEPDLQFMKTQRALITSVVSIVLLSVAVRPDVVVMHPLTAFGSHGDGSLRPDDIAYLTSTNQLQRGL